MTIGVGVQGDGWAVLVADSLLQLTRPETQPIRVRYDKIQQWGPTLYAMWAGCGRVGDHPLLGAPETPPEMPIGSVPTSSVLDMVEKVYGCIRMVDKQARDRDPSDAGTPTALMLVTTPPRIYKATEKAIERPKPGYALTTNYENAIPINADSQEAGEAKALYALHSIFQQLEGVRDWADYPLGCVTAGPDGVHYRRYEREFLMQHWGDTK